MEEFLDALKLHYNDQQAIKLLNELSLRSQGDEFALESNENELQFCMRMYGYCKKISKISKEEGEPIDESLIQKTFYESLATGLKQGAVRLELQKTLREAKFTERELLAEVRLLMNKETDHKNKMAVNRNNVGVKEVDILNGSSGRLSKKPRDAGDSDDGMLCSAITALTSQVSELTNITKERDQEMKMLKKQVDKCMVTLAELSGEKVDSGDGGKRRFEKCDDCKRNKKFCRHCYKCKTGLHKAVDCPENH